MRSKQLTVNQATLFGKTLGQIQDESALEQSIATLKSELQNLKHIQNCKTCAVEIMMSIERYMGRSLPWYLNLINDVSECYEGCPSARDYELGYYGKDLQPGTRKFIMDRLAWADRVIRGEISEKEQILNTLQSTRCF